MKNTRLHTLILIMLISAGLACGTTEKRLQETKLNTLFTIKSETPYKEYVSTMKKIITRTRVDLTDKNRDRIIEWNAPYILKPAVAPGPDGKFKKGILLVHGLSDSPYFLRQIGEHFRQKGFLVYGLLLPGHGTVPGDLTEVSRKEWKKAVRYGMTRLRLKTEKVYMGGFSLGGALAVNYALKNSDVAGLILFAPCLKINSSLAWLAPAVAAIKTWEDVQKDSDYTKYHSFAYNGAAETYRMVQDNDKLMEDQKKRLAMPIFAVQSIDDKTVDAKRTIEAFDKFFTSPKNRLLLYTTTPEKDYDGAKNFIVTKNSFLPKQRISGFSHVGLTFPPSDPHYGLNGDYRYCHHYKQGSPAHMKCRTAKDIWRGEYTEKALVKHPVMARLTHNPFFREMLGEIDRFLGR